MKRRGLQVVSPGLFVKSSCAAVAALAIMALPGKVEAAAFCAYAGGQNSYENCGYHTWEQCLAAIRGRGSFCMRNPHDPALWGYARDDNGRRR